MKESGASQSKQKKILQAFPCDFDAKELGKLLVGVDESENQDAGFVSLACRTQILKAMSNIKRSNAQKHRREVEKDKNPNVQHASPLDISKEERIKENRQQGQRRRRERERREKVEKVKAFKEYLQRHDPAEPLHERPEAVENAMEFDRQKAQWHMVSRVESKM